jgi:hypothetical protein
MSAATARKSARPTRRRPAEVSSLRQSRLTLLKLPPIHRLRVPATVQASPAGSRASPGDHKPEQTPRRLRRRERQPASRSSSFRRSAGSEYQQRCKHRLRGAGLRPATVSRSRRYVGCDGAKVSPPNPPAAGRSLVAEARSPHAPRASADPPAPSTSNGASIACGEPGFARRPQAGADAVSAATARKTARLTLLKLPPIRRLRVPATVQASPAGSRASPGDHKPEQTLCRLRRRERQPASRSSSFRRSAGSEYQQRCKHRLRGAGLRPATTSRSRRHVGCDGAKDSPPHAPRASADPPAPSTSNGASIACGEPGSARRPQAGADAVSAATARKTARLTLLKLPPIHRLRVPATVQASPAGSRAPPGDRKPEQTLCRLRRRDSQPVRQASGRGGGRRPSPPCRAIGPRGTA